MALIVKQELFEQLPPVLAGSTGLEEIALNLLVNAMQALDSTVQNNKTITIRTYYSDKVILEVSDKRTWYRSKNAKYFI